MNILSASNDDISVISDITDINANCSITSLDFETKINEIKVSLQTELSKLTLDALREKCKELSVTGISKMKKQDFINALEAEFCKQINVLKDKKQPELKNICKNYGIKSVSTLKKELLICKILQYNSSILQFTLSDTSNVSDTCANANTNAESKEEEDNNIKLSLVEQLEKQKQEIEQKLKEESAKLEEEKRRVEEEEQKKLKEEEDRKKEEEKKESKKKKQSIPKNVRTIIWNHYIGEDIIKHKCLCCKKVTISNTNFEVGHVLSEKNGGTHEINNLRPICFSCNHSMGAENMIDFVVKFGLYIG